MRFVSQTGDWPRTSTTDQVVSAIISSNWACPRMWRLNTVSIETKALELKLQYLLSFVLILADVVSLDT